MSQAIDKQLQLLIDDLTDAQKKALLNIVKAFSKEEKVYDDWKDESFVAEMDRRYNDYKSGNTTLTSLDEVEKNARELAAKIRSKRAS